MAHCPMAELLYLSAHAKALLRCSQVALTGGGCGDKAAYRTDKIMVDVGEKVKTLSLLKEEG